MKKKERGRKGKRIVDDNIREREKKWEGEKERGRLFRQKKGKPPSWEISKRPDSVFPTRKFQLKGGKRKKKEKKREEDCQGPITWYTQGGKKREKKKKVRCNPGKNQEGEGKKKNLKKKGSRSFEPGGGERGGFASVPLV